MFLIILEKTKWKRELPFENDCTTLFTGVLEMSLIQNLSKFWICSW